jgi:Fic family protein
MDIPWPPTEAETLTWMPRRTAWQLPSAYELEHPRPYRAAVPTPIAARGLTLGGPIVRRLDEATAQLRRFDHELGGDVIAFGPLLLRSEAVASSQIENLTASARAILTAELGDTSRHNASIIAANTSAMTIAVDLADELTPEAVLTMHATLMHGDERHTPGAWRTEAVWIGTDSSSPIGATFVAPDWPRVPDAITDLMRFARRTDLPVLAQAVITHAQFETIHPFTDGNGRTGRALLQAMLRGHGVTSNVTVPVSAGLLTDVSSYHDALTAYRSGELMPLFDLAVDAVRLSIENATTLVRDLRALREQWREAVRVRRGSAPWRAMDLIAKQPVLTATTAASELGVAPTNVYRAFDPLISAGIVQAKTEYKLGRVWRSDAVLQALDAFAIRAGRREKL